METSNPAVDVIGYRHNKISYFTSLHLALKILLIFESE